MQSWFYRNIRTLRLDCFLSIFYSWLLTATNLRNRENKVKRLACIQTKREILHEISAQIHTEECFHAIFRHYSFLIRKSCSLEEGSDEPKVFICLHWECRCWECLGVASELSFTPSDQRIPRFAKIVSSCGNISAGKSAARRSPMPDNGVPIM